MSTVVVEVVLSVAKKYGDNGDVGSIKLGLRSNGMVFGY